MANRSSTAALHYYHPELDLLRFSAFFLVFLFHAGGGKFGTPAAPGAFGVDLFFTLSAYLITEILLREERRFGRFNIGRFYLRRILRIWPLYFVFLALTFAVAQPLMHSEDFPWSARIMFLLFVGNWQVLLGRPVRTVASLLWSVCVEEQFYLTWPLLLRRWSAWLPQIGIGLLAIATACRLLLYFHGPVGRPVDTYWKNTLVHMDPIVAGALVAFFLKGRVPEFASARRVLLVTAGAMGILASGWIGRPDGARALFTYPLAAASCVAIMLGVIRPMRSERIGPLRRLLIHFGRISYGLYVFHAACLTFANRIELPGQPNREWVVRRVAALALTFVCAECSYRLLELPFLRLKEKFSTVKSAPVAPELAAAEAAAAS